ncbi:MAG: RagB/SusD family nutrient uptake outer membrane protein, partial [Dysgonamonadaceae bacterium]
MKKYIFSLLIIAVTLFPACNEDLLDIPQKGVIDIDSFYQTDEDAESALTNLYAEFITNIGGNDGIYVPYNIIFNYCADNVLAAGEFYGDNDQFASINEFRFDSQNPVIYQLYRRLYFVIY